MGVDWVLDAPCVPKEALGGGDYVEGTAVLLDCLKAGPRADALAAMARRAGDSPEGKRVRVVVARADGTSEQRSSSYEELRAQARRLDPLAEHCEGCPFTLLRRPFGCRGSSDYPIPRAVEQWLAGRLQPATAVGGALFLAAIRDLGDDGRPMRRSREAGLFEAREPIRKQLKGGLFTSRSATTDQLFQAIFGHREPLEPAHNLMVLVWLGLLKLDGRGVTEPGQVAALNGLDDPDERLRRTAFEAGDLPPAEGAEDFGAFLRALRRSWVLGMPILVSA